MNTYLIVKSLHIISIVAWFAGLFYLPRLFVYHTKAKAKDGTYETFLNMEIRLYRFIMTPAMTATVGFGTWLMFIIGFENLSGWFHFKLLLVLFLIGFHHMLLKYYKAFAAYKNVKSEKFFRIINEVPTLILIGTVFLAICKPF